MYGATTSKLERELQSLVCLLGSWSWIRLRVVSVKYSLLWSLDQDAVSLVIMIAVLKCEVTITLTKWITSLLGELSSKSKVPEVLLTEDHLAYTFLHLMMYKKDVCFS